MSDVDTFLAHYGVLGMKWGVRKDRGAKSSGKSEPQKPSFRQTKATARYLEKGYTQDIAEKKARGRIAAQNVLAIAGGTVLAAGAGYLAFKTADRHFGGVNLPMGTPVHHVNIHGEKLNLQPKPMFVSFKESDQKFYDSVFANFAKERARVDNVFKSTLKTTTDIKAPSNFEAKRLYKEFVKDFPHLQKIPYSKFNYDFNGEGGHYLIGSKEKSAFVNLMKSKGYNAMVDAFDTTKSLRNRTSRPTIVFDPTETMKKVNDVLLDNDKITLGSAKYELQLLGRLLAKSPVVGGTGTAVVGGIVARDVVTRHRFEQFKIENPNTTLTDVQIYNKITK